MNDEYRPIAKQIVYQLNQLASLLDSARYDRGDRNWRMQVLNSRERAEIALATTRVWKAIKRWGFKR